MLISSVYNNTIIQIVDGAKGKANQKTTFPLSPKLDNKIDQLTEKLVKNNDA